MDFRTLRSILNKTVIVSALGYFVDIYDLILFSIVRIPSLNGIGITDPDDVRSIGATLLNWQMGGMLLGGVLWGVLGDKRGRRSILFGSIALYSIANLANAFVTSVPMYAAFRFLAGVGLAGELGAAVTLVSEVLPTALRGYGTMIVSSVGILGAVVGYYVAGIPYAVLGLASWQVAYLVGGVMGLVLLVARVAIAESRMFKAVEARTVARGDLLLLLSTPNRAKKFVLSILIGLPIWCVIGILVTFSPEISRDLGVTGPVLSGTAVLFTYVAASIGSLISGTVSQVVGSRKNVVIGFVTMIAMVNFVYFFSVGISPAMFYLICGGLGLFSGYWAVFVQMAAEQFGTNLRATVATSVPNFIRGSTVPLTIAFNALAPAVGLSRIAMLLLSFCVLVALLSLRGLPETFGKDLNYLEGATPSPAPPNGRLRRRAVISRPTLAAHRASE